MSSEDGGYSRQERESLLVGRDYFDEMVFPDDVVNASKTPDAYAADGVVPPISSYFRHNKALAFAAGAVVAAAFTLGRITR